jgi:hypothetical protein
MPICANDKTGIASMRIVSSKPRMKVMRITNSPADVSRQQRHYGERVKRGNICDTGKLPARLEYRLT